MDSIVDIQAQVSIVGGGMIDVALQFFGAAARVDEHQFRCVAVEGGL